VGSTLSEGEVVALDDNGGGGGSFAPFLWPRVLVQVRICGIQSGLGPSELRMSKIFETLLAPVGGLES